MCNRFTIAGAVLATLLVAGCGSKSPVQPTTPSSPTPGPTASADPVARVQVKVDDGTPRDALASMSEVIVDASGSTGSGALTFAVDFGDGTSATGAIARHTYAGAGTFTIAATITDAQGRKATESSAIAVKAVAGRWFQAGYVK